MVHLLGLCTFIVVSQVQSLAGELRSHKLYSDAANIPKNTLKNVSTHTLTYVHTLRYRTH